MILVQKYIIYLKTRLYNTIFNIKMQPKSEAFLSLWSQYDLDRVLFYSLDRVDEIPSVPVA